MLLSLLQELGECRDVQITESSARQPGCDFLKQPSFAVGITKRGKRVVSGMLGRWPVDATAAFDLELRAWRSAVEHLTYLDAACDKIFARSRNLGDDRVEALGRTRRGRCYLRAKLNRALGARRRELDKLGNRYRTGSRRRPAGPV